VTWNYRILKDDAGCFRLAEVYYGSDGKLEAWCAADLEHLESLDELETSYRQMSEAFKQPVLEISKLVWRGRSNTDREQH
jgi:hypothetical protein